MNLATLKQKHKDIAQEIEGLYEDTVDSIDLNNIKLKEALKNQVTLQLLWETAAKKATAVYDACEVEVETIYAKAIEVELKNGYKSTTISEAREFAKANSEYLDHRRLLVAIRETRDEARAVLEAVTSRKYILNNITNAVIASVENNII